MAPPVSCILVTRDRPAFFRQALRCFSVQDYASKHLIVVDDGDTAVESQCAGIPEVTYIRLTSPTPTGTKLNIGIDAARGEILQKLDDDDFYAPGFLSAAVRRLTHARREDALVAWCCFLVLIARERGLYFSGHGWKAGGTLCFRRSLWKRRPFRDLYGSSDRWFILDSDPHLAPVCDPTRYLLVRHGANTWRRVDGYGAAENYFRLRPSSCRIRDVVGRSHAPFYEALMRAKRSEPAKRRARAASLSEGPEGTAAEPRPRAPIA
jgi:glycosyltransferase involved in cell wall biosynthesis